MEKITVIEVKEVDGTITEHVIIDRGNDEFTSMLKSAYDAMIQAKNDAASKS